MNCMIYSVSYHKINPLDLFFNLEPYQKLHMLSNARV